MFNIRRSHQRGHFDHGWLKTFHSFSAGPQTVFVFERAFQHISHDFHITMLMHAKALTVGYPIFV